MDIKRIINTFTYRIEPRPEGGFIAQATDSALPPLEAPTRTELQEKIQARISAALSEQFPGLNIPVENKELKFNFHVEAKPGGGFIIHSHNPNADPNAAPVEGSTHEEIELPFAEKLAGVLGKYLAPELTKALAAQGSGDVKVFVNRKVSITTSAGSHKLTFGNTPEAAFEDTQLSPVGRENPVSIENPIAMQTANFKPLASNQSTDAHRQDVIADPSNSPITPVTDHSWTILRFLLALLIIAAIMYFYFHR